MDYKKPIEEMNENELLCKYDYVFEAWGVLDNQKTNIEKVLLEKYNVKVDPDKINMMNNVKEELVSIKEDVCNIPVNNIPDLVADIFDDYEEHIDSKESDKAERSLLLRLEHFRNDLESNNKLSINDIKSQLSEIISFIDNNNKFGEPIKEEFKSKCFKAEDMRHPF